MNAERVFLTRNEDQRNAEKNDSVFIPRSAFEVPRSLLGSFKRRDDRAVIAFEAGAVVGDEFVHPRRIGRSDDEADVKPFFHPIKDFRIIELRRIRPFLFRQTQRDAAVFVARFR